MNQVCDSFSSIFYSFKIEEEGLFEFSLCDSKGKILDQGKAIDYLLLGNNLEEGRYVVKVESKAGNKLIKLHKH